MREENYIPRGWTVKTLGDICNNVSRRFDFNSKSKVIFINTGDVLNGRFLHKSFSDKKGLPGQAKKAIKKGDILYSEIRPKNKRFAIVDFEAGDYVVSTKLMVIEHNDLVRLDFLFTLLSSNKQIQIFNEIAESRSGTFPQITFDSISYLKILLPPLPEQKAIASILTSFDDKIELLQAQNETLETIAQTIFKEWFGKYQVGDELPEGWRVGKLGELTNKISKGTTPRNIDIDGLEVKIPFLKVKDISNEGLISKNDLELIPKQVHEKQLKRSILETNDILFSIAGTIGRVAIVDKELNQANCNQALSFIRLKNKNKFKEYVHLWLKSRETQNEINSSIVQGVQANVSLAVLGDLKITIPNDSQMNIWKELIYPIYSKLENNSTQIQTLQATRDTLLPKLMSGQLRVAEFKEQLCEVM